MREMHLRELVNQIPEPPVQLVQSKLRIRHRSPGSIVTSAPITGKSTSEDYSGSNLKKSNQGDHGKCRANCRCCIPALAGFVSPHSVGPGAQKLRCKRPRCKGSCISA